MLDPVDAAVLVVAIFAATLLSVLMVAARRRVRSRRTLHHVQIPGTNGWGTQAVYAANEADALRRARRMRVAAVASSANRPRLRPVRA